MNLANQGCANKQDEQTSRQRTLKSKDSYQRGHPILLLRRQSTNPNACSVREKIKAATTLFEKACVKDGKDACTSLGLDTMKTERHWSQHSRRAGSTISAAAWLLAALSSWQWELPDVTKTKELLKKNALLICQSYM